MNLADVRLHRLTHHLCYDNPYRSSLGFVYEYITTPKVRARHKEAASKNENFLHCRVTYCIKGHFYSEHHLCEKSRTRFGRHERSSILGSGGGYHRHKSPTLVKRGAARHVQYRSSERACGLYGEDTTRGENTDSSGGTSGCVIGSLKKPLGTPSG